MEQRAVGGRTVRVTTVPGGHQILADGRVLATDQMSMMVTIKGIYQSDGHSYAMVEENSGGTACPAQYQAIDLTGAVPIISIPFGSCSDIPRVSVSNGSLVIVDPGFRAARSGRYIFRDGRLSRSGS